MAQAMAQFVRGKPIMADSLQGVSYSAGDVVLVNNLPVVAHEDNPPFGTTIIQDGLAIAGGEYIMAADAAYGTGIAVYWNTLTKQVTTTFVSGKTFPFGWIIGGPTYLLSDGGPTGAAGLCLVYHNPSVALQLIQGSQGLANFRNLIDGGDFGVNPWQRGTSTTGITNSVTYGPDRFFAIGSASSSIGLTKNSDTTLAGFNNSLKFQRALNNTNTSAVTIGQVLESNDCIRTQGQVVTLSFYAKQGANYSGGALTVQLNHSTTAGDDTAAHLAAASTNWQAVPTIINTTQVITGSWARYQFTGTVPGNATQLGTLITWTPVGTAGADDSVYLQGIQLEIGAGASPFEHRDVQVELEICQRYFFQINEPNTGVIVAAGHVNATNTELFVMPLPVQMRVAPTVTTTVGSFKSNSATAGSVAATGLTGSGTHTPTMIGLTATGTGTAGQGATLQGGNGVGLIAVSADF